MKEASGQPIGASGRQKARLIRTRSSRDLPDLQGFPILADMRPGQPAPMTAPADLPPSDSTEPWLIVLEELPGAPRMMQGALYGLILERRLNSYHLPRDCRIIATGTPETVAKTPGSHTGHYLAKMLAGAATKKRKSA